MGLLSTTHHHHSKTEYVPYEVEVTKTIHEHRAPTDKSVQLLNEFTEKAKQNIIDTIHIKNNVIECVIIYFTDDILSDQLKYYIRFKLNGVEHKLQGQIERMELNAEASHFRFRNEGIMMLVYKKYSELITSELIKATAESHQMLFSPTRIK